MEKKRVLPPKVDEIWDKEFQLTQGKLFNGTVLGVIRVGLEEILLEKVEYKIALSQMRDPELAAALDFKPLILHHQASHTS